jgi:hypothetical protein
MLSSGYTHIYIFCDSYFNSMGQQQRKSRVIRDTIAPISALMTGVLALHSFNKNPGSKEDLLAVIGLATAGTAAALDIYDEHMLFGADNIDSVRTLTKNALAAHYVEVRSAPVISFDAATRHLLDNQAICTPQHILSLTRTAIAEGKVAARRNQAASSAPGTPAAPGTVGTPGTPGTPGIVGAPGTAPPPSGDERVDVTVDNDQKP